MLVIYKVVVATAGTPGPLLGDNVKTTVTMLYPSTLTDGGENSPVGTRQSVINRVAADGRADYNVARLWLITIAGNAEPVAWGARGSAIANMIRAADPASATASSNVAPGCPLGQGDRNDINLGDIDIDAVASGEGWIVVAEVR